MSRIALPDFPWDSLAEVKAIAQAHPGGVVDLSIGTPVDPVPAGIRDALASVSEIPGYPATHGIPALRAAAIAALGRRHGVTGIEPDAVLPTIGSKEAVAWLPRLLGFGPGDLVVIPELAYPTYEVGVLLAGASLYLALGWETEPLSILHPEVSGGRADGLIAVHSLSKSANLASYRAGFLTGDPRLIAQLLEVRKHAGMIVPRPVQEAMVAALTDDEALAAQRERYARRRLVLRKALVDNGFRVDHSEAGLYLWSTRDEEARDTVAWLAERGILVAPGTFYGPSGTRHVRIALTATDERVDTAVERLTA